jgi:hypothetical protein
MTLLKGKTQDGYCLWQKAKSSLFAKTHNQHKLCFRKDITPETKLFPLLSDWISF